MSITNYTELQSTIASYLQRDDLSGVIPDFIRVVESQLNRVLRTTDMEASADLTIDSQTVALPADFREVRRIYIDTSTRISPDYLSPYDFWGNGYSNETGKPLFFTIEGSNILFSPAPDATYTGKLLYYQNIPPLASNSTNWLLTKHPDIYLHGAIAEAQDYLKSDSSLSRQKYLTEVEYAMSSDKDSKYATPLRTVAG